MKKIKKGEIGYIDYMKKATLIKTLILFAISGIIFAAGYIYNGKKENILTVVAVLGVLPACRAMVNFIMFMRFKSTKALTCIKDSDRLLYDLVFTTEKDGSYLADCGFCRDQNIILLALSPNINAALLEKHIRTLLKKNELGAVGVKVFKEEKKFLIRLQELLNHPEADNDMTQRSIALIGAITL